MSSVLSLTVCWRQSTDEIRQTHNVYVSEGDDSLRLVHVGVRPEFFSLWQMTYQVMMLRLIPWCPNKPCETEISAVEEEIPSIFPLTSFCAVIRE